MLETKFKDIYLSKDLLSKLIKYRGMKSVPAYNLAKILKIAFEEIQTFDEIRVKKVKELGQPVMIKNEETGIDEPDKNGNYRIPPEMMEQFLAELEPLAEKVIKIDRNPLKVEDFDNLKTEEGQAIELTPDEFNSLQWLLE